MGYTTDFVGTFRFDRPLTPAQRAYLARFAGTRRMRRDPTKVEALPDPHRTAAGLPVGAEGEYFVGGSGPRGEEADASVVDANRPPTGQPGLWCQWVPDETGQYLGWDGGEKFHEYVRWLEYLIVRFIAPWGLRMDGRVRYQGESRDDFGTIEVVANVVKHSPGMFRLETNTEIMRRQPTAIRRALDSDPLEE